MALDQFLIVSQNLQRPESQVVPWLAKEVLLVPRVQDHLANLHF